MSGPCADCGGPDYQTLVTRVAELGATNEELRAAAKNPSHIELQDLKWALKQAEAELETAAEVIVKEQQFREQLVAERDALRSALVTIVGYAEEFTDGQSVKTRQRLGMAMTYAAAVLRFDPDPMKAVAAHWSDNEGLVTHFTPSRWQPREGGE